MPEGTTSLSDSSSRFQTYFDLYVIFFAFIWILFSCLRFYHYLGEKLDGSLKKLLEDTAFETGASDAIKLPLVALACTSTIGLSQLIFEHYSITVKNCPENPFEKNVLYVIAYFICREYPSDYVQHARSLFESQLHPCVNYLSNR